MSDTAPTPAAGTPPCPVTVNSMGVPPPRPSPTLPTATLPDPSRVSNKRAGVSGTIGRVVACIRAISKVETPLSGKLAQLAMIFPLRRRTRSMRLRSPSGAARVIEPSVPKVVSIEPFSLSRLMITWFVAYPIKIR